jgi:hypothetical protein
MPEQFFFDGHRAHLSGMPMHGQQRIEFYYTFSHPTVRTSCNPYIKAFSDDLRFNILSLLQ